MRNYNGQIASIVNRIKALTVSLYNSYPKLLFGNGAATSIIVLPELSKKFEKLNENNQIGDFLKKYYSFGTVQ